MNFKKMKKVASRGGFSLRESQISPYNFVLVNNRTLMERHYVDIEDVRPDVEEIAEGGVPFA